MERTPLHSLIRRKRVAVRVIAAFAACILAYSVSTRVLGETSSPNQECLTCHGNPGLSTKLSSGETLLLGVDAGAFATSIHGREGITCRQCHVNITSYPHSAIEEESRRIYTIKRNEACFECHSDIAGQFHGGVHDTALAQGNLKAAVCTDCHGSHDTIPLKESRIQVSHTCQSCHSDIYDLYSESVHGSALEGQGNPDVPDCIDCHGAHFIKGPSNAPFRMQSPQVCARCHADRALAAKYGLNPNVVKTWKSDFHGKTVILTEAVTPNKETDKAVCIDCHGVHDILAPDNPQSTVAMANLLATCRKCHPYATANFSDAWPGHSQPSLTRRPIVFWVTWFYRLLIPGLIGGMLIFVVSDYARQIIDFRKERKHG